MPKITVNLSKNTLKQIGFMLEAASENKLINEITRDDVIEACVEYTYRAILTKKEGYIK